MNFLKSSVKPLAALLLSTTLLQGCDRAESPAAIQTKTQEYIDRAENYRSHGQYRAAIIETRNALQKNPKDAAAIAKLADIMNELGQGKTAAKLLEPYAATASHDQALAMAQAFFLQHKYQSALDYLNANTNRLKLGGDVTANLIKARAELRLGMLDAASTTLQKLPPDNIAAGLELARLELQRGDKAASGDRVAALLKQHPENIDVLSEAALRAEQANQLDQAEDLLSRAVLAMPEADLLVPQKTEVLQRLVTTLSRLGRSNEALIYAKTLSDANPQGAVLQDKFKQALELFQARKYDEAEPILNDIYNESHNDAAGTLLGMIHYAKKDFAGASRYLSASVDPEVSSDSVMATLAATQLQLSQPDKLLAMFDAKARDQIKSPELKALIGVALLQTGKMQEGEKLLGQALSESPDNQAIAATAARYYVTSNQADKAVIALEKATTKQPDDGMTKQLIGAYLGANKPEQALATARKLANQLPAKAENWWTLGRTAMLLNKPELAEPALQSALKIQPDFLPAQLDLAQLQITKKAPDKAEAQYRSILQQHPEAISALKGFVVALALQNTSQAEIESQTLAASNTDSARAVLAEYHLRQQKTEDAARLLQAIPSAELNGYTSQLRQLLASTEAQTAMQARDFDKARAQVLSGLKVNPANIDLLVMLARIEITAGKLEEAKKVAEQIRQLKPEYAGLLELTGDIATLEKKPQVAAESYRKAWQMTLNNGIATKLFQSLQSDDKATTSFLTEWIQRQPKNDLPLFLRGMQQQNQKQNSAAIASYEAATALNPNNAQALNNLAWLYNEAGDTRALATAEKAYNLAKNNPAILDTYGWLLIQKKQREKGLEILRAAAALAPEEKDIQMHIKAAEKGDAPNGR